jgi:hypothetical protein
VPKRSLTYLQVKPPDDSGLLLDSHECQHVALSMGK